MSWTVGVHRKIGPQGLVQHIETSVTPDSTTATDVAHGFTVQPDEFYIRTTAAGSCFGVAATATAADASNLAITCTPSASTTTFVLVAKCYDQSNEPV